MNFIKPIVPFLFLVLLATACNTNSDQANTLTEEEKRNGWTLLFDGKSTDGWHVYNKGKALSSWKAENGELFCQPGDTIPLADLISDKEYENFDFTFDWKLAQDGNSGIFINVVERPDIKWAWASGPEYQLLDSAHIDNRYPTKKAGCLYGFYPQKTAVKAKPAGEWNHSEIKQVNGAIQFYLNGTQTAEANFKSPAWQDTVATSGFKDFPEFGKHTKGHIVLQDWASGVYFKNLKLKQL